MDKWSLKIWTLYFRIPKACTPGQLEYSRDHLSRGTKLVGDHLSMGTKFDGDRLSRGTKLVGDHLSMGTKFLGTICPWGHEVGDRMSGDQMGSGPNESQP